MRLVQEPSRGQAGRELTRKQLAPQFLHWGEAQVGRMAALAVLWPQNGSVLARANGGAAHLKEFYADAHAGFPLIRSVSAVPTLDLQRRGWRR